MWIRSLTPTTRTKRSRRPQLPNKRAEDRPPKILPARIRKRLRPVSQDCRRRNLLHPERHTVSVLLNKEFNEKDLGLRSTTTSRKIERKRYRQCLEHRNGSRRTDLETVTLFNFLNHGNIAVFGTDLHHYLLLVSSMQRSIPKILRQKHERGLY